MPVKSNRNINLNKINLYNNNVKTYTGYYSNNWANSVASSAVWTGIACTEDGFAVAIANGTTFNYSDNGGIIWSATTVPTGNWQCITYSRDLQRFVVVQNGATVLYSNVKKPTLTSHWTSTPAPGNLNWQKVVAGANLFVAVSSTGTNDFRYRRLMVSANGINWRIESPPVEIIKEDQLNTWISLVYGNGTYVAICNSANIHKVSKIIYSQNDANTWHSAKNNSTQSIVIANIPWSDITYSSKLNLFIAVAVSGGANTYRLAYSENGTSWSVNGLSSFVHSISWSSIVWSQELEIFIVIENVNTSQRIMTSNDGKNWTLRTFDINKIISGIIWNRHHGNFIAVSSATAAINNIIITKPLGINSFLSEDQYYNKKDFESFTYEDINDELKDGIIDIYNAPWGISPKLEYNINNTYSINEQFPINSGLSINNKNGVIRSTGTSAIINQIIERIITVTNLGTGKTLSTNLKIKFIPGDVSLVPGDYYYTNTSNNLTLNLASSNVISLSPTVLIVKPYVFRFAENNSLSGLQLNGDTGIISGPVPYNSPSTVSTDLYVYSTIFEEEEKITLTLNIERRYSFSKGTTSKKIEKRFLKDVNPALIAFSIGVLLTGNLTGIGIYNYIISEEARKVDFPYTADITGFISGGINYHFFIDAGYSLEGIGLDSIGNISVNSFKDSQLLALFFSKENIQNGGTGEKRVDGIQYLNYSGEKDVLFIYFRGNVSNPFTTLTFPDITYEFNISSFTRRWIPEEDVTVYFYRASPSIQKVLVGLETVTVQLETGPLTYTVAKYEDRYVASIIGDALQKIKQISNVNIVFK